MFLGDKGKKIRVKRKEIRSNLPFGRQAHLPKGRTCLPKGREARIKINDMALIVGIQIIYNIKF
jgi:hypothetical protein